MGVVIAFPAEKCTAATGLIEARDDSGSIIILPVIRIERQDDSPGLEPTSSSPRGKRRKR